MYVWLFWDVHWHRYVLYFFVILCLSVILFALWSSMFWMGNLSGLFFMFGGGVGCCGCCGTGGCKGGVGNRGVSS